jgi:hypothetical protein
MALKAKQGIWRKRQETVIQGLVRTEDYNEKFGLRVLGSLEMPLRWQNT